MIQALHPPRDARGQVIALEPISGLLDLIQSSLHPTAVWLFGSRARGEAKPTSDWDLLVVVPDDAPAASDPMAGWNIHTKVKVPADIIVCPSSEFAEGRETVCTLAYEATHFGVPLYGC